MADQKVVRCSCREQLETADNFFENNEITRLGGVKYGPIIVLEMARVRQ